MRKLVGTLRVPQQGRVRETHRGETRCGAFHAPYMLLLLALTGCSMSSAPQFRLNTEGREPGSISSEQADAVTDTMRKLFGTPDEPAVPPGIDLRLGLLQQAAGPIRGDAEGNQWGLYRRHCASCHGTSGDGAGPSAAVLNPYPRDFRTGIFKYTSTAGGAKPLREDLLRTLRQGIPGTAMPSFRRLPDGEIDALIEYAKYLSIRGQTELYVIQSVVDEDATLPLATGKGDSPHLCEAPVGPFRQMGAVPFFRDMIEEGAEPASRSWDEAKALAVIPTTPPATDTPEQLAASIARGHELFLSTAAQCVKCHGPNGDGNGEQSPLFDDWNKVKQGDSPLETENLARRFRLPIEQLHPRNFTLGKFRGGDRPVDQYWRIYVGIKGTPMPAAGASPGSDGALTPEEIWHLVNYVRSLGK